MATRKAVTIKLDTLPSKDQKLINKWLDAQYNQQLSLATLLMHLINQLEVKDIMSFEMQRLLHTQGLHSVLTQTEHHTGASLPPVIPIETVASPSEQPSESTNAEPKQDTEATTSVKKGTIDEHVDPNKIAKVDPILYDEF